MGETGRVVASRYEVRSAIGQGGMGRVWRAHDRILEREVALKEVLLPRGMSELARNQMAERMLREARLGARLRHPAIVRIHDVLIADERPWIVMELVEGRSLEEVIAAEGPLAPYRVATLGLGLLGALRAAHRSGVIHRDVKPANVLVEADDVVVLTDFGIAYEMDQVSLTATGTMIGSPQFMAPERVRGESPGPASDLFSLGATLYAAVEGRAPFVRTGQLPTLAAVLSDPPDAFVHAGPLQPVLAALLEKDPEHRLTSEEAEEALRTVIACGDAPTTGGVPAVSGLPPAAPVPALAEPNAVTPVDGLVAVALPERHPDIPAETRASLVASVAPEPLVDPSSQTRVEAAVVPPQAPIASPALLSPLAPSPSATSAAIPDAPLNGRGGPGPTRPVPSPPLPAIPVPARQRPRRAAVYVGLAAAVVVLVVVVAVIVSLVRGDNSDSGSDSAAPPTASPTSGATGGTAVLPGPADGLISGVAYSPDGRTLAAANNKNFSIQLWDITSSKVVRTIKSSDHGLFAVVFSPDGRTIATSGHDANTVRLWDVANGKNIRTLSAGGSKGNWIYSLAFSADGKTLATGNTDKEVWLWDVPTGRNTASLVGHTGAWPSIVYSVAFSPDGKTLATGSADKTARLWDVTTHKTTAVLTGHQGSVQSVAFSGDGKTLVTGSADNTVRLWDVATRQTTRTLTGHTGGVENVAFSPANPMLLATGSSDSTVRLWNIATGATTATFKPAVTHSIQSIAFSPDGTTIACAFESDPAVRLWSVAG